MPQNEAVEGIGRLTLFWQELDLLRIVAITGLMVP